MVTYNAMTIERIEQDNKKRYKVENYQKLNQFYQNKIQQIHIIGEYARKMVSDYKGALQFVDDYFKLNYPSFLNKYFKGDREDEIGRNITPTKFRQLFAELSPAQLAIINDKNSPHIVVAAGPGSGKTRILVHKLASLLLMEDVKSEQLLMLTFSRSSATEFKKRLIQLIGNPAYYVAIKTFHSYCFDLLGKVGNIEKSDEIIKEAVNRIENREVEPSKITKTVLVIDEAQDIDADEFALITTLMKQNDDMRLIAVGDDDQNIFEFRGANSIYLGKLIDEHKAVRYELVENFRSKSNIVDFANQFAKRIPNRLKQDPIIATHLENGKIKLVRYTNPDCNLITPVVRDILSEGLSGTTCVLTRTNEEALQITGLLLKNGLQAKLIQSNEGFDLYNLLEIRFFLNQLNLANGVCIISDDVWNEAKQKLKERFVSSPNLEICLNLINDFEATLKSKYKSDLEIFIHESKMEDFFGKNIETIFVSTIHKAKGREFDNVFLMLNRFDIGNSDNLRPLYVALTRAKNSLTIHYDGNYLDSITTEDLKRIVVQESYPPPRQSAMQLTHKDVWLDYFASCQPSISQLNSGDKLTISGEFCCNLKGIPVLKFSKERRDQIEVLKQKGYLPKTAKIRFIVYWKGENLDKEIEIILPELYFERTK